MTRDLAARILALPESTRAVLATVEGPGWQMRPPWTPGAHTTVEAAAACPDMRFLPPGSAWWPANPAQAVAVVLGCELYAAYMRLAAWLPVSGGDDYAVALAIIEDRVGRGPTVAAFASTFVGAEEPQPSQTVTNLGHVGEVVNLQGPVTLSIGADGVKVTR